MKQEYKVIQTFEATAPISDTKRRFSPGEVVICDIKQSGSMLALEAGEGPVATFYLVDRHVFEACCKWISRTAGSI